jgi:hypothetical protein
MEKGLLSQMKRYLLIAVFLFSALALPAQSRDDVKVFLPPVSGGVPEQQMFFAENFRMELQGANYAVVDNHADSDYTMNLTIAQELEDGYEDEGTDGMTVQAIVNVLTVSLIDSKDGREVLQFSWAFEDLEEMYEWNLHLIYQAMANVPLTKLSAVADSSHWRNKWIYVRASFDYPITFYANPSPPGIYSKDTDGNPKDYSVLDHKVRPFPGFTAGLEFQFLNWMSVEGEFQLNFEDPFSHTFIPSINVELKFPLKPSQHFMLEPYAAVSFPATTSVETVAFPRVGFGGGAQLGVRGGPMGAFFVDVNFIYYPTKVKTKNTDALKNSPPIIEWDRFVVGLGIGYKIGFINRNKTEPDEVIAP